ncbi:hypothetical protein OCU04_006918 [Sclerotinia nivalis]|uniref:Cell wall mannoprotein PIR1-like C-terminal domain-containing protein n=1 Tax=Sclerotinia nivalis TaxID=352851 RepID=A0A9X0AKS3_9HELO|nr:hypothetical protein OCU04_006918 [Sclerotinia nivalis]
MKTTFAVIAGLASVASAQVTALITPTASAPSGCATSYSGAFEISAVNVSSVAKRQQKRADCSSSLAITLNGGILKDQQDRTGYVASNTQFQFDKPAQEGAIYTGGWSVCSNGSLALGGSAVFYQCLSGTFYNLYTESQGGQCSQILIQTTSCSSAAGSGVVGQSSDGQATATAIASLSSASISQISDGQPQAATSAISISQISDGQVQVPTSVPTGASITQIPDGQVQGATTTPVVGASITQIPDGQVQGATSVATPPASAPISQISDGQVQGATSTAALSSAVISQIPDGQIQATTAATLVTSTSSLADPVISQIPDGQIQAPTATNATYASATATPATFTGAANTIQIGGSLAAAVIGLVAALL